MFIACLLMLGASGCASGPADDFCLTMTPSRPTEAELKVMTDERVTWTLEYNTYGAARCGWRP